VNLRRPSPARFHERRIDKLNSAIHLRDSLLSLVLIASIFSIVGLPVLVYGQSGSSSLSGGSDSMKKQTSGGSLDVVLQPSPEPVKHTAQTSLKVQFLTKGSNTVQPHIDYEIVIKDSSGKQVFTASQLAGQPPPLHTSEGIVTIPYTFQSPGDYTINVTVYGILFNPIKPESTDFTVKVT
jgi:hypothetical protein